MKKSDYKATNLLFKYGTKIFLTPLTWLYGAITDIRNFLYDRSILTTTATKQFSVVVGNLTVGGTGKTPMVEYLLSLLRGNEKIVTLSRGYGRRSRGFVLAEPNSTADQIGDEPLQYYKKFGNLSKVAVCEDRVEGSKRLFELYPDHPLLLLDDAFQHRPLKPDVAIVLNDFNRPFYEDEPFPAGRLRERRHGIRRADAIITTKCPNHLSGVERSLIIQQIKKYSKPETPIFFSGVKYGQPRNFDGSQLPIQKVRVVVGIAEPLPFINYVRERYAVVDVKVYSDHYNYTKEDIEKVIRERNGDEIIMTTEKDMVKLLPFAQKAKVMPNFAYIPIEVDFGEDKDPFLNWLHHTITMPLQERSMGIH